MVKLNLQRILQDRNITQKELSRLTGIRPSTICDMCNNNADFIKLDNLDRICSVLGCGVEDVVSFVPSANRGGNNINEDIKLI